MQCTADLLPADIVGTNVYNQREERFEFRPGPDLRQRRARRRGQPRVAEDAVRPARVHAGAPRHRRRPLARARAPVPRLRDAEPGRVRGHLPAARGAGRPLHGPALARLPERRRRGGDARRPRGAATACSTSSRSPTAPRSLDASDAAHRVHASRALRDYIVALLRRTRDDHRVELGASPRAGLMLLRAAKARALVHGPRPRAARRRPGARRRRARAPHHARPRGGGRRALRDRRRRDRGDAGALGSRGVRSALGCAALGLLLLLVAGTFDAEPLYVTGAALLLLGAGARGLDRRSAAWGASVDARARRAQRRRGAAAAGHAHRGARRAAAAAARLDRRAAAARAGAAARRPPPGARAHRGHASAAAAGACCRRPRSCCATRSGSPSAWSPGRRADELLVLPRIFPVTRRPRAGRDATPAHARAVADSPPPRPRSTACARTARARPPRASTGRRSRAAPG